MQSQDLTIDGSGVIGSREGVAGHYVDIVSESDIALTENLYLQPCKMREVNCGSKLSTLIGPNPFSMNRKGFFA